MTEKQLRKLARRWQRRLGLGHVEVDVEVAAFDPVTNAGDADCSCDYDRARIRVQRWLLKGKPPPEAEFGAGGDDYTEEVLVHELLHVALRPLRRARALIEDTNNLHRDVERLWVEAWEQREEEVVDRLAVALVAAWGKR